MLLTYKCIQIKYNLQLTTHFICLLFRVLTYRMRQRIHEDRGMPCVQVQVKGLDLNVSDPNNNRDKSLNLDDFEIIKTIGEFTHFVYFIITSNILYNTLCLHLNSK